MLSLLLSTMMAVQALAVMKVQVPEQPVVALHGMDATLNCSFSHPSLFNLSDLSIFWQLTDTQRSVHAYSQGRDQLEGQAKSFASRTSLFHTQLGLGNASLLLRRVMVADEGSYTCFVRVQDFGSAALFLQVAAPYSKPVVTFQPDSNLRPGDELDLTCVGYGGYPEPTVIWQDEGGRNLTDNVTTSVVANEEGLFSIISILTVVLEPSSTYSCQLINPLLGEEGYASVTITGSRGSHGAYPSYIGRRRGTPWKCGQYITGDVESITLNYGQNIAFPPVALWVTVGLAVCLLVLLIALAAVCRRKIKESCEEARREAEEAKELEEEESKTAMTPLKS